MKMLVLLTAVTSIEQKPSVDNLTIVVVKNATRSEAYRCIDSAGSSQLNSCSAAVGK